jgi:hypothetical protein
VACVPGGGAWSLGDMSNSCPVPDYPPVYLDGGPAGAFCCAREADAGADAADAAGGDASGGPCTANSDCNAGDQCLFPIGDCAAQGQCLSLASLGLMCAHTVAYCGCNGATVAGLCGPPYAYGPTPSADAASSCGHADAGDAGAE